MRPVGRARAAPGLPGAQRAKLDLIAGKLGLRPGTTLLDIGCGWGSLALHAAREYGAQVTAVTLAGERRVRPGPGRRVGPDAARPPGPLGAARGAQ